ncbi:MAG: polysaccharide deacetylase family protein [Legionellales bacterium]
MLIVLMYHNITHMPFAHDEMAFENHLQQLKQNYSLVVPGDKLDQHRPNVCLTFDDAYFEFYHYVFPLLQKLNIPAVLAIPTGLIQDTTDMDTATRLQVAYPKTLTAHKTHATLCTWEEINTMVATELVIPAAHGHTHQALTKKDVCLELEIINAKQLLQEKTQQEIKTFIYPYGRMTRSINKLIHHHYTYSMRIGSALNLNWRNAHKVVYRINADAFWLQGKPFLSLQHKLMLWSRFLNNTLRLK